jgi:hypothetical protein
MSTDIEDEVVHPDRSKMLDSQLLDNYVNRFSIKC